MAFSSQRIDNYARSMFSREHLNHSWVSSCAEYLREVFGEKLSGAVFLDYAFGRGNWSVAALQAGARRVISIDASSYNVEKLNAYCLENSINGIEIIHGNIMQEEFNCDADFLWIYGILHHIPDDSAFLKKISNLRRDDSATALLYAYDKGSLREAIVETARLGHIYETAESFAADTLLFSPAARLRARDDLTAPHVAWYSQNDLARLAESVGLYAVRKANDFSRRRLSVEPMSEFRPHHLICEFQPQTSQLPDEPTRPEQTDISIIREFGHIFGEYASQHDLRAYPIGLFNTHFVADRPIIDQIVQDYLFLSYAVAWAGIKPDLSETLASNEGRSRDLDEALLERSIIARHIKKHAIRF
jgi:predicted RNA methylase